MSRRRQRDEPITLRQFLTFGALMRDTSAPVSVVIEAVATTALAHPDWPSLDERRTWEDWVAWRRESSTTT